MSFGKVWVVLSLFSFLAIGAEPGSVFGPRVGQPPPAIQPAFEKSVSTLKELCPVRLKKIAEKTSDIASVVTDPVSKAAAATGRWMTVHFGRATYQVSPEAKEIFDSATRTAARGENFELTPRQKELLEKENLTELFASFEKTSAFIKKFNSALGTLKATRPHSPRMQIINNLANSFLLLKQAAHLELRQKYSGIYTKVYENPKYKLTAIETERLKGDGLLEDLEGFRKLVNEKGKYAIFSEQDLPEYLLREWKKANGTRNPLAWLGFLSAVPQDVATPELVQAQVNDMHRFELDALYRKVAANPDQPLSTSDLGKIQRRGLEADLEKFRTFVRQDASPDGRKAEKMLIDRWRAETWRDVRSSAALVRRLPWEVLSMTVPFAREFNDRRAKNIFEGHVLESKNISEKAFADWANAKKAKSIYKKVSEDPEVILGEGEVQALHLLGLLDDIEKFREHINGQLAAHGTPSLATIAHERELAVPEDPSLQWSSWANDQLYLDKYYLSEDFKKLKEAHRNDPEAFRNAVRLRRFARKIGLGLVLSAAAMGFAPDAFMSTDDSYDLDGDPSEKGGMSRYDEKVELIFTSPLPHASIRIGGLVYNYGQGDVQRVAIDDYKAMVGFGRHISGSHIRVELKLTQEEKWALGDRLEADVGKRYPLLFPFNDCISMVLRAVRESTGIMVPPGVDRSQVGSLAWFKMLKMRGSERVGNITYAGLDGDIAGKKTQDAAMNVLDGVYFLRNGKLLLLSMPVVEGVASKWGLTW